MTEISCKPVLRKSVLLTALLSVPLLRSSHPLTLRLSWLVGILLHAHWHTLPRPVACHVTSSANTLWSHVRAASYAIQSKYQHSSLSARTAFFAFHTLLCMTHHRTIESASPKCSSDPAGRWWDSYVLKMFTGCTSVQWNLRRNTLAIISYFRGEFKAKMESAK